MHYSCREKGNLHILYEAPSQLLNLLLISLQGDYALQLPRERESAYTLLSTKATLELAIATCQTTTF